MNGDDDVFVLIVPSKLKEKRSVVADQTGRRLFCLKCGGELTREPARLSQTCADCGTEYSDHFIYQKYYEFSREQPSDGERISAAWRGLEARRDNLFRLAEQRDYGDNVERTRRSVQSDEETEDEEDGGTA